MSENPTLKSNTAVTEAPASWNTKYVTPDGFVCQLTLRGESGKDLLEKANAALTWLKDNGFLPCENNSFRPRGNGSQPETNTQANNNGQPNNGNRNSNGHSDISLTLNTYSHVLPSMQEEAAEKLDELLTMIDVKEELKK